MLTAGLAIGVTVSPLRDVGTGDRPGIGSAHRRDGNSASVRVAPEPMRKHALEPRTGAARLRRSDLAKANPRAGMFQG